jgi:hypothetical protein
VKTKGTVLAVTTQCVLFGEVMAEVEAEVEADEVAEVVEDGGAEVEGAGDEKAVEVDAVEVVFEREVVVKLEEAVVTGVDGNEATVLVGTEAGEDKGTVVFATADVILAEARSALRRGVAATIGQRAAEGVHFSLGCGLAFFARRKCKMTERALSHSTPFSNTA